MSKGPLEGIRVLECTSWLAGPTAGYMLGDLGAEVIKIEEPGSGDAGRGLSSQYGRPGGLPGGRVLGFETTNRNKRGITLNLQNEKGRALLYTMVGKSDVFLTSLCADVTQKLKIDYPSLRQHNPKLIYAHATGWGEKGSLSNSRAFDFLVQGPSGLMWNVGDRDSAAPSSIVGAVVDTLGGTMVAYGILAALVARERQGVAQELTGSLLGTAMHMQALNVNSTLWTKRPMHRHSRTKILNALTTYYRCADGQWLILCEMQFDKFWPEFCEATGVDPAVAAGRKIGEELVAILDQVFATKPREEWLRIFREKGCRFAYAPVNSLREAVCDPQVVENEYVVPFDHPTMGATRIAGFPIQFGETPCKIQGPAPELGQHTEEVLMDLLGCSWEEVGRLREEGVI